MKNTVVSQNKQLAADEVLKATSLIYLRDALVKEQYEQCPELVKIAKDFGASLTEVRTVIAEYVSDVKAGRLNEATASSRQRF
jgi:hypothetical protein